MIAVCAAVLLYALAGLVAVPVLVLVCQIVAGRHLGLPMGPATDDRNTTPSIAILVPAHDEASGIAASLATVTPQLRPGDRLVVVADNCSDATARVATSCGAEVIERHDIERRGKGYALDFGVRHLQRAQAPPSVVIVVDADCDVAPGSIDTLAHACGRSGMPVQALYLMLAPDGAGLKSRIAEFAWAVRNELRPRGAARLGGPCQLMGTGMAFPWEIISRASLATGHIVEDMLLGLDLARAGTPPVFCEAARMTSRFPATEAAQASQRTRWEHGHLSLLAARGLPLLVYGLAHGRGSLVAMALDVCVPPLASLLLLVIALSGASAAFAAIAGNAGPLTVSALLLVLLTAAVILAWTRVGRRSITMGELLSAPLYALRKIPIYVRLFTARQMRWVRTQRDDKGR